MSTVGRPHCVLQPHNKSVLTTAYELARHPCLREHSLLASMQDSEEKGHMAVFGHHTPSESSLDLACVCVCVCVCVCMYNLHILLHFKMILDL